MLRCTSHATPVKVFFARNQKRDGSELRASPHAATFERSGIQKLVLAIEKAGAVRRDADRHRRLRSACRKRHGDLKRAKAVHCSAGAGKALMPGFLHGRAAPRPDRHRNRPNCDRNAPRESATSLRFHSPVRAAPAKSGGTDRAHRTQRHVIDLIRIIVLDDIDVAHENAGNARPASRIRRSRHEALRAARQFRWQARRSHGAMAAISGKRNVGA